MITKANLRQEIRSYGFDRITYIVHTNCPRTTDDQPFVISGYDTTDGKPQCLGCLDRATKKSYKEIIEE